MSAVDRHGDECVYSSKVDCDICPECGDHASFCEDCGESDCCGAREIDLDAAVDAAKDRDVP